MATSPLLPLALILASLLFPAALAATPKPAPAPAVAPGPTPEPLNLTGILAKGGQFATLTRLLRDTQIGDQVESQLNNSFGGLTLFAPTDAAFAALKPGTLNSLTAQQQAALVLFHVLPRYYTLAMFETTSNPVSTQATGNDGVYTLNVTTTSNQVNVSTGVNVAPVSSSLYSTFPLAVYQVDKVLLPYDLFGPKPPAVAPVPAPKGGKAKSTTPSVPSTAAAESTSSASARSGLRGGWWSSVVAVGTTVAVGMISVW